ncbi:MAG TPA: Crp/Fnr family transcriptional regulator [Burkholderiales bacterium]|nr:Crp/Fnr family transcriptional regulator [Burkholderiales bacterium]
MLSTPIKTQAFLRNLPLFRELAQEEIDRVAAGTRELRVRRSDVLFQKGDPSRGFHIVVYGQVKLLFVTPQGDEKVIEIMGPGQSFGEAVMFTDKPYPVAAQALVDSMLLHVSRDVVFEEIDRDPQFARRMIAGLSRRLHHLISDVEFYSMRSATQRVIGYLLRSDADQAEPAGFSMVVTLPASKSVIASRLNITPEHFSRTLHELSQAGLIEVAGRDIKVPDVERLRTYEG